MDFGANVQLSATRTEIALIDEAEYHVEQSENV